MISIKINLNISRLRTKYNYGSQIAIIQIELQYFLKTFIIKSILQKSKSMSGIDDLMACLYLPFFQHQKINTLKLDARNQKLDYYFKYLKNTEIGKLTPPAQKLFKEILSSFKYKQFSKIKKIIQKFQKKQKIASLMQKAQLNISKQQRLSLNFAGLPNVGNSCFLNSVIQFLFGATHFREKLIETISKMQNSVESKQMREAYLVGSLFRLLKESDGSKQNIEAKIQKLKELSVCLQSLNLQYKVNNQEDAFQTLHNLVNKIDYQLPKLSIKEYFNILSKIKCSCCLQPVRLKTLFLSDKIEICCTCDNQYTKQFENLPFYIIFVNLQSKDTVKRIQEKTYRLKSIINYYGDKTSGHYTCSRLEQQEKQLHLYCFNDSTVRKEAEDDKSPIENTRIALFEQISQEEYQKQKLKHNPWTSKKNQHRIIKYVFNLLWKNKKIIIELTLTILALTPILNKLIWSHYLQTK